VTEKSNKLAGRATLVNALGLHARSAAMIAQVAKKARSAIRVKHGEREADAASVIDILTLACPMGETLEFIIEAPEDCDILRDLLDLVNNGFGEKR